MSVEEWLSEATPDRREVSVCLDRRLVSELKAARQAKRPTAALEAKIRNKTRTFTFEGVGWGKWRDLIAKHPPSTDQAETFQRAVELAFMPHAVENINFDATTFYPAATAASCVDPVMTSEEALALFERCPPGVIDRIIAAVLEVNLAGGADPFVPASSNGRKATARKSRSR